MGAAATLMEEPTADADEGEEDDEFDFDAEVTAETREAEASADLQKVVDYLLDSHLERVATLGAAVHRFREAKGLPPGAMMPSAELVPYLKADKLVNIVLDVPARIEEDGALTTLGQVLDQVADGADLTWSRLVQHLKSESHAHQSHKLPVMRAVFDAIDTNGNGSVDRSELLVAMKKDPRVAHFMGLPCQVKDGAEVDESAATVSFLEVFTEISKGGEGEAEKEIDWDAFKAFVLWK
mmetsp:Transcript_139138/g.337986  ORF Transcript_139138/g.337986 Transcript_139138/m.337986 type:complete len:238 (+) Transcript_139138:11-724(+)